jgi:hypothetical protein
VVFHIAYLPVTELGDIRLFVGVDSGSEISVPVVVFAKIEGRFQTECILLVPGHEGSSVFGGERFLSLQGTGGGVEIDLISLYPGSCAVCIRERTLQGSEQWIGQAVAFLLKMFPGLPEDLLRVVQGHRLLCRYFSCQEKQG